MTASEHVMGLLKAGIPLTLLLDLAGVNVSSEELLLCEAGDTDLAEELAVSAELAELLEERALVGQR